MKKLAVAVTFALSAAAAAPVFACPDRDREQTVEKPKSGETKTADKDKAKPTDKATVKPAEKAADKSKDTKPVDKPAAKG